MDMTTVLKAAINALQDMDYTKDVLNSDVGLSLLAVLQNKNNQNYPRWE
ncbi:MAG: hypothetical protein CM1200mP10_29080 [Candidatus Neomarinimicrobiota bacterium]|nr:MAG: hypothetical protein CM1200mP10_29080 [Candidatus Neomarinimicrobiota bacterium]